MAVDGQTKTFWASKYDDTADPVEFLVDLGSTHTLQNMDIVGRDGAAANVGLLQVRMQGSQNNEFGSVCGMNAVCL